MRTLLSWHYLKTKEYFKLDKNCFNCREPCDVHEGALKVFHLKKQICLIPSVSCNTTDCCQVLNDKPITIPQKAGSFHTGEKILKARGCRQATGHEVATCNHSHFDCNEDGICTSNKFANDDCHKYNYCQVEI